MRSASLRGIILGLVFSSAVKGQPGKAIRGSIDLKSGTCLKADGVLVTADASPNIHYELKISKGKFAILGPRVLNGDETYKFNIATKELRFEKPVRGVASQKTENEAYDNPCPVMVSGAAKRGAAGTPWERAVLEEGGEQSKSGSTAVGQSRFKVELVGAGEQLSRSIARWRNQTSLHIARVEGESILPLERIAAWGDGVFRLDGRKYSGAWADATYQLVFERPGYEAEMIRVEGLAGLSAAKVTLERSSRRGDAGLTTSIFDDASRGRSSAIYEIDHLPIGGRRSADFLALLNPGVVPAPMAGTGYGPGFGPSIGSAGEVAVNGIRPRMNNFVVDGADNNDESVGVRRQGFVFGGPYALEAIREFQSATAMYDARFGRASGGQFNLLTLVGTSVLRGKVYGYLGDSRLSARDSFNADFSRVSAPTSSYYKDGVLKNERYDGSEKDRRTNTAAGFVLGTPLGENSFASINSEWRGTWAKQTRHFAVPTIAERGFNRSGATGLPAYGNARITNPNSPEGDAVFSLFPFANNQGGPFGANTFTQLMPADEKGLLYSVKLNHTIRSAGAQHHLSGAFLATTESSTLPVTGGALYSTLSPNVHSYAGTVFFDSNFGANTVHAFRIALGQANFFFGRAQDPLLQNTMDPFLLNQVLLTNQTNRLSGGYDGRASYVTKTGVNSDSVTGLVGEVRVAGFSGLGADVFRFPQARRDRTIQISDSLTHNVGIWTLAAGLDFWNYRFKNALNANSRPYLQFNGQSNPGATGSELSLASGADLVAYGLPAFAMRTLTTRTDDTLTLRRNQLDTFFQANGRLKANFTVSLGIRAAFHQLPSSEDGRFEASFDQATYDRQYQEQLNYCDTVARNQLRSRVCRSKAAHLGTLLLGEYDRVFSASRAKFDPRVGLAWAIGPAGKTIIRAGWGLYTSQFQAAVLDESRSILPASYPLNFANGEPVLVGIGFRSHSSIPTRKASASNLISVESGANPVAYLYQEFDGAAIVNTRPAGELLNARAHHSAVTVEQRINRKVTLSLAYVNTGGTNLLRRLAPGKPGVAYNGLIGSGPGGAWTAGVNGESNAQTGSLDVSASSFVFYSKPRVANLKIDTGGSSSYHSLQGELRGRLRNAQIGSAFTWGHSIDDASDFFDTRSGYALPRDSYDTSSNRASSDFDTRIRSVTSFDWQPAWSGRMWSGWRVGGIYTLQQGMPFSVNTIYDSNADGLQNDGLWKADGLLVGGADRRLRLQVQPGTRTADLIPTQGIGGVGRNAFRGAGMNVLDLGFGRSFAIGDRQLSARLEGFNVLNQPTFGMPVRLLGAPGFGGSFDTATNNRRLQIRVQFQF